MLSHPLPLGEDGLGDPRGVFPSPRANPQAQGACAGASSQQASRLSARRHCKNAAVCKLFNSLGFALPTCSPKAEGKVCVRGMWRAETRGSERRRSFTSPSFKCTFQPSLLPSQRLPMPRGQRGDGEDGHTAFQGTGSDAVTVRHCSLPAKEPAARSQHRPATLSKVTPPGDCRAGEPVAFGGLRWGHSCIPDRSSPGHAPAASPSPAPPRRGTALDETAKVTEMRVGLGTSGLIKQITERVGPI